ncbi:DNA-directed RNA polymerase subunit omega [Microvirga makkahensis]|uniref:DNA-directed RNA polymerase subunit omega n=1 Tax=Microvirga makkahensis TaxID=1128670 RepID=A0A7X3MRK9_9HYPH|nr:DNA-directed RNA polymerase subunit omega [Microvirga makkahensis]MXQ11917.1 DNA-directed RNA polymerase subunit omega [Microvirga makkahensis]
MARITTCDCERFVPNRFELVLLAAERAHRLAAGAEPLIARGQEPVTLLALREIASGRIELDRLRDELIGRVSRSDHDMPFGGPSSGWLAPGSWTDGSREGPSGGKAPERVH